MSEPHDELCIVCGEQLDQCLDPDCTEDDHHVRTRLCAVCEAHTNGPQKEEL
jgi:hypothetical protein